jgi:hypothetical protein
MELELATFDLRLAIDNARTFVHERATTHGITLDVEVDERLGDFSVMNARSSNTAQSAIQRGQVHSGGRKDRN